MKPNLERLAGVMNANGWITFWCITILGLLGAACFFWEPRYPAGIYMILVALVGALSHATGSESGSKLPQQLGDAKPGQSSQTETTTKTEAPAEPPAA